MYLIGLTLAYFIIAARARAQKLPMNKDQVYDMIVYAAVGVFAGGRLGYVLFYNLPTTWRIHSRFSPSGKAACRFMAG